MTVTLRRDELDEPVVAHVRRDYTALLADQTVASGPIVLATADVATLLFYFNLAGLIPG
jgi:hypothetical protein